MEQLHPSSRWYPFVSIDPERLGGEPAFRGSRVHVQSLFDYLTNGHDLDEFLNDFDGVPREFAIGVLKLVWKHFRCATLQP